MGWIVMALQVQVLSISDWEILSMTLQFLLCEAAIIRAGSLTDCYHCMPVEDLQIADVLQQRQPQRLTFIFHTLAHEALSDT